MDDRRVDPKSGLRRVLGFGDVLLYLITAGTNLQWVATAAAAGPSSLSVWLITCVTMALPLAFSVVELASRYPEEGGVYVWSKRAFGDGAAFLTGWTYWLSNLPYFPGVLYFAAGNLLYLAGGRLLHLASSPLYFVLTALLGLALGTGLNLVGLNVGKWLSSAGAVARWAATLAIVALGGLAWIRFGPSTRTAAADFVPGFAFKDLMFLATIAFAQTGLESASFMGEEIKDARRTIPRAVFVAVPIITLLYLLGTASVLVALPAGKVSGLQGIMEAVLVAARRLEMGWIVPLAGGLIALSALGSVGAWLGSTARIPFVAGIDHYLPRAFGRIHPRWRTPHVALLTMAAVEALCVLLGQAGMSVRGAYGIRVSMTIITYMIPFLFLFAAVIRVQSLPAGPGTIRMPGGRPGAYVLGSLGFLTTSAAIVLSIFPGPDEPHPGLAVTKVLGLTLLNVGSGIAIYAAGRRRRRRERTSADADAGRPPGI